MANWVKRKTTKGPAGVRFTTTTNYSKGFTNSQSIGNKNGRTTMTQSSNGKNKMTQTYHVAGMTMRKTVFSSAPKKTYYKKIKSKKLTRAEISALSSLTLSKYFWGVLIFVLLIFMFMK